VEEMTPAKKYIAKENNYDVQYDLHHETLLPAIFPSLLLI